ncbi:MAG: FHA domain-containing protein, partial [Myxococcales bacterium]|nr:FHA domain-containing protein [Myxococcales bacterium]
MENTPVKFDIYEGDQLVRTEILSEATIKVGKLSSSHLRIDDESVSRMHAVIEVGGPESVVLLDLGSSAGTFVNGEKVTKRSLRTGDQLQFGNVVVVVAIAGQEAPQAALPPEVATVDVPLFDESEEVAGASRTMEVMCLWGTTVLDVQHIENGGYTVGASEAASQYADPQFLGEDPFTLATAHGGEMVVNVPQGASGEVMLDGKVFTLEELAAAGKLAPASVANARALRLPARARCRVQVGHLTFLVNSVVAAPPVRSKGLMGALDGQLMRYLLTAGVLHGLFFLIVLSIPEDADSLDVDGFDMSDRFVEFILKPEEEKQEKLQDLFKGMKEEEGKAAEKAKGDEGKLGKKDSDDRDKRFAVEGPADNEEIQLAREQAKMEALRTADAAFNQLEGELSAVWGTGDRAVGSDAVSALGNMFGDQVGTAQGFGGLGTAGVGRGGGGFGEASIGV